MTGATLKEPVQAAIVCQPQSRRLLRKGWFHMIGGAGIVVLTICFPQDPVLFLIGLAPWVLTAGAASARRSILSNRVRRK